MLPLTVDPGVGPLVRVGVVGCSPIEVMPSAPLLKAEIAQLVRDLSARHAGKSPAEIDGLGPARRLYRAFGIDPTTTRPSSEGLLRRILRGKPFPEVSSAVDVANLCSVSFLLPIGLYDAGKIVGPATLRRGRAEEFYPGIRKDRVNLAGRPVLADSIGPFGNPTSDSLRTSVDGSTASLWMVIFAPLDYPAGNLEAHAASAGEVMRRHLTPKSSAPKSSA